MKIPVFALPAALLIMLASSAAEAAASRTFVSGSGNDANTATNCGVTSPCRTFNAALSVTSADGQVVALDTAGYGPAPVTITQGVTIMTAPGALAALTVGPGASGIVVNAPAGANVTLSGLNINSQGGSNGVYLANNATALTIIDSSISGFTGSGSGIYAVGVSTSLQVINTTLRDNFFGIRLQDGPTLSVSGSRFLGNTGVALGMYSTTATASTAAWIMDSTAQDNASGFLVDADVAGAIATLVMDHCSVVGGSTAGNSFGVVAQTHIGSATAAASVSNSVFTNTQTAIYSTSAGSSIVLNGNTINGNTFGVAIVSPAVVSSFGNNAISSNLDDISGGPMTAVGLR